MRDRNMWQLGALLLVGALVGCGDDAPSPSLWEIGAAAAWQQGSTTPPGFGYDLAVLITQRYGPDGNCHTPPLLAETTFTANGHDFAPVMDQYGCVNTPIDLGLSPSGGPVIVDVRENGGAVAHAQFDGLAPGVGATLAAPAGGMVRAGDDIVIVPPPDLASSMISGGESFYLIDQGSSISSPGLAQRLADGIHVTAPAFTGRAALTVSGMPYIPDPTFSCSGFAACAAIADNTLGPVYLTGVP
jgi:hypothetical protein